MIPIIYLHSFGPTGINFILCILIQNLDYYFFYFSHCSTFGHLDLFWIGAYVLFFFLLFCLFMRETERERERGRDTGRSRLCAGSLMRDSIRGLRGHALSPRQRLHRWATQASLVLFWANAAISLVLAIHTVVRWSRGDQKLRCVKSPLRGSSGIWEK